MKIDLRIILPDAKDAQAKRSERIDIRLDPKQQAFQVDPGNEPSTIVHLGAARTEFQRLSYFIRDQNQKRWQNSPKGQQSYPPSLSAAAQKPDGNFDSVIQKLVSNPEAFVESHGDLSHQMAVELLGS